MAPWKASKVFPLLDNDTSAETQLRSLEELAPNATGVLLAAGTTDELMPYLNAVERIEFNKTYNWRIWTLVRRIACFIR